MKLDDVLLALRETKDQRESQLRGLFNFFVTSNTRYLDFVQIEVGLTALQILTYYKYAKDLLRVCDADRDGELIIRNSGGICVMCVYFIYIYI